MLDKKLRNAWHVRERAVPISPVLNLTPEGLVLGAGTVLVAAEGERRLRSVQGGQVRVLALLSAAYGRAVKPSVLSNIERAAKCWREGDDCLAYIRAFTFRGSPIWGLRCFRLPCGCRTSRRNTLPTAVS